VVKCRHLLFAITLAGSVVTPGVGAQQIPRRLTIAEALDLAEKQNLDLVATRARRAVAQAGVRIAGQRPNPTGSVSVSRDAPHEGALVDQPVEIGPKRGRRIEVAKQEGALTETEIAAVEKNVRHRVRDAYFTLAHARGASARQADVLKLAQRLLDIAQARFQAGDVAQLEVTQADLEVARAQADLQVTRQEEKVALTDLNSVLNEPVDTDWDLGEALAAQIVTLPLPDLLTRAVSSNAEIARIMQEQKVEQSNTALLKAERIPDLGLQFGVDLNNPGPPGQINTGGYMVGARGGLSMELPIFSHNQGEIAESLASERVLEGELAAARKNLDASVSSAYYDLQARQTQAQIYHDTILPSSRRLEEMAEESYRAGKANLLVVLTAQHDVQQVERDYLDSLLALQSAFAQLEEAVGSPLD
jgi:cobalt-zinc-cadmium efflux system outer membrane protein